MSDSNNSPNPLSTTSNQLEETPDTSSYESESNESDEPSRDKLNSPALLYSSMARVQPMISPLKFSQGLDVVGRNEPASPAPTVASFQSEQSMDPPATFRCSASRDKPNSPALSYSSMASVRPMNSPLVFNQGPDVGGVKWPSIPSPHMVEAASPASVESDQSVAPGIAFKNRASRDKPNSPALSYSSMARVRPMISPLPFSQGLDVVGRNQAASPAPTVASFQSEQSMDPPATFSCSESYTSVMMKEHLRCSVCKDMLKEPVSIPCGHSFCKTCILDYWNKPTHAGSCCCPQCMTRFKTRPALNLNLTLANVVQTQQQAALLTQSYAGPGDVACDMCSGSRIRAVKSCLTCCTSYCESHVRRHYTVEALQEHILREPTKHLEQEVYETNTSAEVGRKDLMSNMMNEMKRLNNAINKMTVKLEDVPRGITPVTEAQHLRKCIRTELEEDFVSQVRDFAVPDLQLPEDFFPQLIVSDEAPL